MTDDVMATPSTPRPGGPDYGPAMLALLADGRFPSGGHAHSNGYEAASAAYELTDTAAIRAFIDGRLDTSGRTDACLLAATMHRLQHGAVDWAEIDSEIDARIASPSLRAVSRSLGRQWLRSGRQIWSSRHFADLGTATSDNPHQVGTFATVADAAGLDLADAVTAHLHHLVAGAAAGAVRLHGLDPFEIQRCQVDLVPRIAELTDEAISRASCSFPEIPAVAGPLTDLLAEDHAAWDVRLFQS